MHSIASPIRRRAVALGHRALAGAAAGVTLALLGLAGPPSADAALTMTTLKNVHSGKCLTADRDNWFDEGAADVSLTRCANLPTQRWYRLDKGRSFELRTIGPPVGPARKCLGAWPLPEPGPIGSWRYPNGIRVGTFNCDGSRSQRWTRIGPRGTAHAYRNVGRSEDRDLVLGIAWGGTRASLFRYDRQHPRWWEDR